MEKCVTLELPSVADPPDMWKSGVENVSDFFGGSGARELHTGLPEVINSVLGIDMDRVTLRLARDLG